MTVHEVKCPKCLKPIDCLEYDQEIIEHRMIVYDKTTGLCEDEKLGEDGGDTSLARCPECGWPVARNRQEAEEFLEPCDEIIRIEGLIPFFKKKGMNILEWYIPEYDKTLVVLVVCDSSVKSEDILQANRIFNITQYNKWDASSCYIWDFDEPGVFTPIHRGEDSSDAKNPRWITERTSAVHLYYKINEVGVPETWTKRMRRRHARGSQPTSQ